jgi:5'-3' exonuclease
MEKNLIIDAYNTFFSTIHVAHSQGQQEFMVGSEIYDYWKHLVIQSWLAQVQKEDYKRVIIAYDNKNGYFRHDIYPAYKGNRKKGRDDSDIDFQEFLPILDAFVGELKEAFPMFHHLRVAKAEADDIAAVVAKMLSANGEFVRIITSDKDYIQLLQYPNIEIIEPRKKTKRTSMNPKKDLKIKCVMGDRGDNIFAIKPRCGIKTAQKLVESGEIDDLMLQFYDNPETLTEENHQIATKMQLNTDLISFECIPIWLQNDITHEFVNYTHEKFSQGKLIKYCSNNNLNDLGSRFLKGGCKPLFNIIKKRKPSLF